MSSKYSTKQRVSAQCFAKEMSEIWCKNIQAFLRYSNYRVGIFYFASPCTRCDCRGDCCSNDLSVWSRCNRTRQETRDRV